MSSITHFPKATAASTLRNIPGILCMPVNIKKKTEKKPSVVKGIAF